ncbi:MAG: hypothetical protein K0S27_1199 [Gammaproteobacteria bacterium]|jgi:major structural subunit of bundle-forming pilus|nr:hypothetical protein [Gammaproteobacteria bacterium]
MQSLFSYNDSLKQDVAEIKHKEKTVMKKFLKSMVGVTLLEIMLVLAIAAMVILMSIRYYQSASNNQKINSALNVITAIVSAGESYLTTAPSGGLSAVANANFAPYLGGTMPTSPWGGPVTVTGATATTYTISMPASTAAGVCTQMSALLAQNNKFTDVNCANGTLSLIVNE